MGNGLMIEEFADSRNKFVELFKTITKWDYYTKEMLIVTWWASYNVSQGPRRNPGKSASVFFEWK